MGRVKLAPVTRDAGACGRRGRLGHGPGRPCRSRDGRVSWGATRVRDEGATQASREGHGPRGAVVLSNPPPDRGRPNPPIAPVKTTTPGRAPVRTTAPGWAPANSTTHGRAPVGSSTVGRAPVRSTTSWRAPVRTTAPRGDRGSPGRFVTSLARDAHGSAVTSRPSPYSPRALTRPGHFVAATACQGRHEMPGTKLGRAERRPALHMGYRPAPNSVRVDKPCVNSRAVGSFGSV